MNEPEWKVDKQPAWLVASIKKTITDLDGGYVEAAEWLGVTENALFNRLRADGDQIFPLGWAMVLQRAGGSNHIANAIARHSNGVFVPLADIEEVDNADINQRLMGKRTARTVLTGMCYSVGSVMRQGSSSLTRLT
ncbi:YmfL family putative regulatory protein, partial [Klebsiella sp. 10982]|uniref:YmfL family putative regulatory protein n=1 Tax=Klebsiella sp. 10982 TaxID=1196034 RepID=UPI000471EA90